MVELILIRHAPALTEGRLAGRRDVPADCSDRNAIDWLRALIAPAEQIWASPALRCRQTAEAIGAAPEFHDDLWEQDFGTWEGLPYADLPDLGALPPVALAAYRPPGGESFDDMAARVQTRLGRAQGCVAVIAHAGVVRAGLALAVGPAALSFSVAPLSVTVLHRSAESWTIEAVNRVA